MTVKRLMDLTAAALGLIPLAPLLLLIALALRLSGTRSPIHTEARVGRSGRSFRIHKFRTMREDRPAAYSVAVADDPRITKPGRFLRRWRLDELPQLYDVLRGAMSLVGPRPQKAENLEAIDASSLQRLQRVRPGITGPAAIDFLGEDEALIGAGDPIEVYRRILLPEKVRLELEYLEHWTLFRDLDILVRTLTRVFSRRARQRSYARIKALIESGRPG